MLKLLRPKELLNENRVCLPTCQGFARFDLNVISSCFVFCKLIVCVVCAYADRVPQLRERGWRS